MPPTRSASRLDRSWPASYRTSNGSETRARTGGCLGGRSLAARRVGEPQGPASSHPTDDRGRANRRGRAPGASARSRFARRRGGRERGAGRESAPGSSPTGSSKAASLSVLAGAAPRGTTGGTKLSAPERTQLNLEHPSELRSPRSGLRTRYRTQEVAGSSPASSISKKPCSGATFRRWWGNPISPLVVPQEIPAWKPLRSSPKRVTQSSPKFTTSATRCSA
jgi:hypothetical protein